MLKSVCQSVCLYGGKSINSTLGVIYIHVFVTNVFFLLLLCHQPLPSPEGSAATMPLHLFLSSAPSLLTPNYLNSFTCLIFSPIISLTFSTPPPPFLQTRVSVFATFTFSPPFSRHLCYSFNLFWNPLFFVFITTRSPANSSSHISSPLSSNVNSSTMMANNSGLNADHLQMSSTVLKFIMRFTNTCSTGLPNS